MAVIKQLGFTLCIAMVLIVYLRQLLPSSRNVGILKGMIGIFVLLSVITAFKQTELNSLRLPQVESKQLQTIEEGMCNEMNRFLKEQGVDAEVRSVKMEWGDSYRVIGIALDGRQSEHGKQLLSLRYGVQAELIEVHSEG